MNPPVRKLAPWAWGDVAVALLLLVGAWGGWRVLSGHAAAAVVVFRDNTPIARYGLERSTEVTLGGAQGAMRLHIDGQGVAVVYSECPHQLCAQTGRISKAGQQIVCVPNHIVIELRGEEGQRGIDAVAR
jgi:hypothetical protein